VNGRTTIRPDSGGLVELELFKPDPADDIDPESDASIMLKITEAQPRTEPFALSPETAKALALALLEQVDAYERWKAAE
jgi:hypothetical protein